MKKMTKQEMMEVNGGDKWVSLAWCGVGVAMAGASGGFGAACAAVMCYGLFTAQCATEAAGY